jgi:hypothetical protein
MLQMSTATAARVRLLKRLIAAAKAKKTELDDNIDRQQASW